MSSILSTRFYFLIQGTLVFCVLADLAVWYLNNFMVPSWVFSIFISASIMLLYVVRILELKLKVDKTIKKKVIGRNKPNEQNF
jgi:hypothetical protein